MDSNPRWNFGDSCYHNSGAEMNWLLFSHFCLKLHFRRNKSGLMPTSIASRSVATWSRLTPRRRRTGCSGLLLSTIRFGNLENIYIYTFLSTQLENLKKFPPFSVNTHTGLLDWADWCGWGRNLDLGWRWLPTQVNFGKIKNNNDDNNNIINIKW